MYMYVDMNIGKSNMDIVVMASFNHAINSIQLF